jgi:hypothetical protein
MGIFSSSSSWLGRKKIKIKEKKGKRTIALGYLESTD